MVGKCRVDGSYWRHGPGSGPAASGCPGSPIARARTVRQPAHPDVAASRCNRRYRPVGAGSVLPGIMLQHFAQQLRVAPAVHQHVMAGVDQVLTLIAQSHQRQAHQRRPSRIQLQAFAVDQLRQRFGLIAAAAPSSRSSAIADDDATNCTGRFEAFREVEAAAQDVMTRRAPLARPGRAVRHRGPDCRRAAD